MQLIPLERMRNRVLNAREDSDTNFFLSLLYEGEQLTKLIALGLIAGVVDDKQKHRYSQLYSLVRANGIGDWSRSIEEALTGPTSHFLMIEIQKAQRDLTQKVKAETWQYECLYLLNECLKILGEEVDELPVIVQGKNWFHLFARLRNKTRGHGAPTSAIINKISKKLEESILLLIKNFSLFEYEWVYLSQNLSGKYRINKISESSDSFNYLKSSKGENFTNGVYIFLGKPVEVELVESDVDLSDFYFANGGFTNKRFEVLSYITGNKDSKDNSGYLLPTGELPQSETEGIKSLDVLYNCFTNLPKTQSLYIPREELEAEVTKVLLDDRHPIVTLVGKGGIGKTSLALSVLKEMCKKDRFELVLWFSARDIDLFQEGAKPVKPHVLDEEDIAKEFTLLIDPPEAKEKGFKFKQFMERELVKSSVGPTLIVLDNFETVKNPGELFNWLDTYIRNPNKILITSRFREFKADYPITVGGMHEPEFKLLVDSISEKFQIKHLITEEFLGNLYDESDGHPYVVKILLGEVAREGKTGNIKRIVASKDEILTALFERTYVMLSQVAKRVLLTLCSWRSVIPQVALEAILRRDENEVMDVEGALKGV